MQIILYSNDCPKCKILKQKLDDKNITYDTCSDVEIMKSKGFKNVPMLEVDTKLMTFEDSVKWIKENN